MVNMTDLMAMQHEEETMRGKLDRSAYVTVKELADKAGVAPTTVYFWISEGLIQAERMGLKPKSHIKIRIEEANRVLTELSYPPFSK